jgi:hypothetical protein
MTVPFPDPPALSVTALIIGNQEATVVDGRLHGLPATTGSQGPVPSQPAPAGSAGGTQEVPAPMATEGHRVTGLLTAGPVVKLLTVRAAGGPAGL